MRPEIRNPVGSAAAAASQNDLSEELAYLFGDVLSQPKQRRSAALGMRGGLRQLHEERNRLVVGPLGEREDGVIPEGLVLTLIVDDVHERTGHVVRGQLTRPEDSRAADIGTEVTVPDGSGHRLGNVCITSESGRHVGPTIFLPTGGLTVIAFVLPLKTMGHRLADNGCGIEQMACYAQVPHMTKRSLQLSFGVVGGLLVALAIARPSKVAPGASFLQEVGPLLPQAFAPPAFVMLDPAGDTVRISEMTGTPVAIFFGYTHCPDVCPITLAQLLRVREERGLTAEEFPIVFVSMDPQRDTPDVLRRFAAGFGDAILVLTDREEEVWRQANLLGIQAVKGPPINPEDPNSYLVEHSARTHFLDEQGQVVASLPPLPELRQVERTMDAVIELVRGRD